MGMTIDEAIEGLHDIQKCYNDDPDAMILGFDDKDNKSVDFAIDTMHKYQKIQEIMAKRPKDMISSNPTLRAISEVLKDGLVCRNHKSLIKETRHNPLSVEFIDNDVYVLGKDNEAVQVVIETIHKYQKMLEILEKVWNIPSCMIDKAECLDKIMETYRTVRRQNEI